MDRSGRTDEKGPNRVISMKGWKQGRKLEETLRSGLIYQSFLAEDAQDDDSEASDHFEIAYSIRTEEYPEGEQFFQLEEEISWPVMDRSGCKVIPFQREVIERYEFYDLDSDDVHVIYRIPYKPWDGGSI